MNHYRVQMSVSREEQKALLRWRSLDGGLHVLMVAVSAGQPVAILGEMAVENLTSASALARLTFSEDYVILLDNRITASPR